MVGSFHCVVDFSFMGLDRTSDECPVNVAARFEHVTSGSSGDAGVVCGFEESGTGQGAGGAKFCRIQIQVTCEDDGSRGVIRRSVMQYLIQLGEA